MESKRQEYLGNLQDTIEREEREARDLENGWILAWPLRDCPVCGRRWRVMDGSRHIRGQCARPDCDAKSVW